MAVRFAPTHSAKKSDLRNPVSQIIDRFANRERWEALYPKWKEPIERLHRASNSGEVPEFEFRFTDYPSKTGGYRISPKTFDRLLKTNWGAEWGSVTVETTNVRNYNHSDGILREITTAGRIQVERVVQRKTPSGIIISDLGFSVSLALEKTYPTLPPNAVPTLTEDRQRIRHSWTLTSPGFGKLAKLDLTEVRRREALEISYSMELEFLPVVEKSTSKIQERWYAFCTAATRILPILRQGRITKIDRHFAVLNQCNAQLAKIFRPPDGFRGKFNPWETRDKLEPTFLTKPRNLHSSDLRWGYIYGNVDPNYSFTVTVKADGERRLLYIVNSEDGGEIWLLGFPTEARLIVKESNYKRKDFSTDAEYAGFKSFFTDYNGAIIDGELIPASRWRSASSESTQLFDAGFASSAGRWTIPPEDSNTSWFLAFDMIARSENSPVAHLPLRERTESNLMALTERFKNLFSRMTTRPLVVTVKSYFYLTAPEPFKAIGMPPKRHPGKPTTEERVETKFGTYTEYMEMYPQEYFFSRIRLCISLLEALPYKTDGLIFTPQGAYDPLTVLLPGKDRQIGLGGVMDVLKWKISTDLTVDLAVTATPEGIVLETVSGGSYIPFTTGVLDPAGSEILGSLPPRSIVEFQVQPIPDGKQRLIFRGRRYDKDAPNSTKVVADNLRLLRDPITADTLAGRNMKLVFFQNNRIKANLIQQWVTPGKVVLDIGIGKGGDLKKMENASRIYGVEPNFDNLGELRSRLDCLEREDPAWRGKVQLLEQGGEQPISPNVIPDNSVDVVVLMFCLTFFWEPSGNAILLRGLLRNINRVLKVGGHIIFATLDGNAVEEFFSENCIGGYYRPPLGTLAVPVLPGNNTEAMILDSKGKELEMANATKRITAYQNVVDGKIVAEIRPLENGQIWTSIPESATITGQAESLVYIRDITRLQPNFSLIKTGRFDRERLLTEAQATFSGFYMYGAMTKAMEDQYTIGSVPLTESQVYAEMARRATGQPPAAPSTEARAAVLLPLQVLAPPTTGAPAEGDDVRQLLDTNYLASTQFLGAEDPSITEDKWVKKERLPFSQVNSVRIACIPASPPGRGVPVQLKDNIFHAILKAASSSYWRNNNYDFRLQKVEEAKAIIRDFITGSSYHEDILKRMQVITTTPVQIGNQVVKDRVVAFGQLYTPPSLAGFYDEYLRGLGPLDDFLLPIIALCFNIHIAVFVAAGPKAMLNYVTTVHMPTAFNFPHTIVLVRFDTGRDSYHYELVGSYDMASNNSSPFWQSADQKIVDLSIDAVDSQNINFYMYKLSARK